MSVKTWTVAEVARALNVSPQAVRKYCRRGKLKGKLDPVTGWRISGGPLLEHVDMRKSAEASPPPPPPPPPPPDPEPVPEPEPEAAPPGGAPPGGPEGESPADAWERVIREEREKAGSSSSSSTDPEDGPGFRVVWSSEMLLAWIRDKLPREVFKRHELPIWLWCQVAPEFLPKDLEKAGKLIFYGVPIEFVVVEALEAKKKQQAATRAKAEASEDA